MPIGCLAPMNAVYGSAKTKNGRPKIKLIGDSAGDYERSDLLAIPCNVCVGCRARRANEWSVRCALELKSHRASCFITLTYADQHLPKVVNQQTGEFGLATLRKKHMQLFIKRLRKTYGAGIRFFGCGEYGPRTARPHFHILVFGWSPSDLRPFPGRSWQLSKELSRLWPYGFVSVGQVSQKSVAYVAGYCCKKIVSEAKSSYLALGLEAEFRLMSRRPGIGKEWFEKNGYPTASEPLVYAGHPVRAPSYFDFLQDREDYEVVYEEKKLRRHFAKARSERLMDLGVCELQLRKSVVKSYLEEFKVARFL